MSIEHVKNVGDVVAGSVVAAALLTWLPPLSALLTFIWMFMRIVIEWPQFIKKVKSWL